MTTPESTTETVSSLRIPNGRGKVARRHRLRAVADQSEDPALRCGSGCLSAVGIDAAEEHVYRTLLAAPRLTVAELADRIDMPCEEASRTLKSLASHGMATEWADRYTATPPDVALEALVVRHEQELHQIRVTAAQLADQARVTSRDPDGECLADVLTGHDAVARMLEQLHDAAAEEALLVVDSAQLRAGDDCTGRADMLERGVAVRAIYDPRLFQELDGYAQTVHQRMVAGEQAVALSPTPGALVIIDQRLGILPRCAPDGRFASALLLRRSMYLEMLIALFDCLWNRSAPLAVNQVCENERIGASLVSLLAAGLTDQAIARQLGVSPRTLDRRLRTLMDEMDAKSRFQAGWVAAHRHNGNGHRP